MLTNLHIENIAIIDSLDVEITSGFVVLTGETGAGKSIIIDAINMLLGERVSRDMVRTGEKKAFVSAVFTDIDESICNKLEELGYGSDTEVILSRELSAEGKSVARINGRPVSVSILREIGTKLVNIHGQHDNQQLLNPATHIEYLDSFGSKEILSLKEEYSELYSEYNRIRLELKNNYGDDKEKQRKLNFSRL